MRHIVNDPFLEKLQEMHTEPLAVLAELQMAMYGMWMRECMVDLR